LCQADNVSVLRCTIGWSKLHTWQALHQTHTKDYVGNAVGGNAVVMYDSSGCIVKVPNDKLVIIQGLEDYIIADSDNALLICKKSEEKHLKNMTNLIARKNGDKFL
jgi:mannose-1-phosphate guanylyltransferase